jgi:hypothetical protein
MFFQRTKKGEFVRILFRALIVISVVVAMGEIGNAQQPLDCYTLGSKAQGCTETVDNIVNVTIVSKSDEVLEAEYNAGFLQGRLQKRTIPAARDNFWDTAYLVDPDHTFPAQIPPSIAELAKIQGILMENYAYTLDYIKHKADPDLAVQSKRLIFRLLGIYHGARFNEPRPVDFSGRWLPGLSTFEPTELVLGYETPTVTFADIYFINGFEDAMDVIGFAADSPRKRADRVSKCTAFVKKTPDEIYIAHNTWSCFLSHTLAMNLFVNGDLLAVNSIGPGQLFSATDFGYNNKGMMFNETTHHATFSIPQAKALWMFFRASLAEQFSGSIEDFYRYLSLEPSGTNMNGYMVVDAQSMDFGLIEMSYKTFVFFKSDGKGGYTVETKPAGRSKAYDPKLLAGDYILGVNYPVSRQIREDLAAVDTRPARKRQLWNRIGKVNGVKSARALITYTAPNNPLSIYGRWDLGYGVTSYPKTVPDGSIDAKVATASMARKATSLKGILSLDSKRKSFWMKYGTPYVNGLPFIWGFSQWSDQKLRDVPNVVDGHYRYLNLYLE